MSEQAGVEVNSGPQSDATADIATHLVQSGILDEVINTGEEPSPSGPVEQVEEEEDESQQDESEEENPQEETDSEDVGEEESEEEEEVAEPVYSVKSNGKVIKVTLDELTGGYQRQSDYTQKTQELAQARKAAEADYSAVIAERQQYQQALGQFGQMLSEQKQEFENIDWNELAEIDPTQYLIKKDEQRELEHKEQRTRLEGQRIQELNQREQQRRDNELLTSEWNQLEEVFPDWKVPEKRTKLAQNWEQYGVSQGYASEEVNGIKDHRALKILNKAMLYDKIQAASAKKGKVNRVPKTAKPGVATRQGKTASKALKTKMSNLKQSGSVDDAARLFFDFDL
jgi:hypothetical protein